MNAVASTPASPAMGTSQTSAQPRSELKEYVAAALSLVIVGIMLYFLWNMFVSPEVDNTTWERQSAIVQIAVSLAGAVIGYYFGRIPAERAATAAQQSANSANQSLVKTTAVAQQASANEQRIRTQVAEVRRQLSTPLGGGAEPADVTAYRAHVSRLITQIID